MQEEVAEVDLVAVMEVGEVVVAGEATITTRAGVIKEDIIKDMVVTITTKVVMEAMADTMVVATAVAMEATTTTKDGVVMTKVDTAVTVVDTVETITKDMVVMITVDGDLAKITLKEDNRMLVDIKQREVVQLALEDMDTIRIADRIFTSFLLHTR